CQERNEEGLGYLQDMRPADFGEGGQRDDGGRFGCYKHNGSCGPAEFGQFGRSLDNSGGVWTIPAEFGQFRRSLDNSGGSAAHRRVSGGMNVARPFKAGTRYQTHPRRASDE